MSKYQLVPVELLEQFREINPSNYGHDDVCALNAWAVEVVLAAAAAPAVRGEPVLYVSQYAIADPDVVGMHATRTPNELQCVPLYAAPQMPTAVQPGDECPRCNGKGRHATGPIDCPAMTICKLCSAPSVQGEPIAPVNLESLWVLFVEQASQILDVEQERLSAEDYLMDSRECIQTLLEARPQFSENSSELEDCLSSKKDFYDDAVEDIAFALAFECEEAELDPNDKVIINREKLKAIAARVLEKAERRVTEQQPAPDVAALVEALEQIEQWVKRWCADGHPIAKFAGKALAAHRGQGGGA